MSDILSTIRVALIGTGLFMVGIVSRLPLSNGRGIQQVFLKLHLLLPSARYIICTRVYTIPYIGRYGTGPYGLLGFSRMD